MSAESEVEHIDEWVVVQEEKDELTCPICLDILHQPVNLSTCPHACCRRCLGQLVSQHSQPKCPSCREPLSSEIRSLLTTTGCVSGIISEKLRKASTKCPHCHAWEGRLGVNRANLIAHRSECGAYPLICSVGCGESIARSQLAAHEGEQCPRRLVVCGRCEGQYAFESIQQHHINERECERAHLCVHGCGDVVADRTDYIHRLSHCTHRTTRCPVCSASMEHRHLSAHMAANVVEHITLLSCDNATFRSQLAAKQDEISALRQQLSDVPASVQQISDQQQAFRTQLATLLATKDSETEKELSVLAKNDASFGTQLDAHTSEISDLRQQLSTLRSSSALLTTTVAEQENEVSALRRQLSTASPQLERVVRDNAALNGETTALRQQVFQQTVERRLLNDARAAHQWVTQVGQHTADSLQTMAVIMRTYRESSLVQAACCQSLFTVAVNSVAQLEPFVQLGGVECVVHTLTVDGLAWGVHEAACGVLWKLSGKPSDRACVVMAGGIEAVVRAMKQHSAVSNIQLRGCMLLANIAADNDARPRVLVSGAVGCVVSAMKQHKLADVHESGCRTLANLCVGKLPQALECLRAAGVVECVVSMMKVHSRHESVQMCGCQVLLTLADGTESVSQRIVACGGRDLLLSAKREHPGEQAKWGVQKLLDVLGRSQQPTPSAAAVHPVREPRDYGGRTVVVTGLSSDADRKYVSQCFQQAGEIGKLSMPSPTTPRHDYDGVAHIEYVTSGGAKQALSLDGKWMMRSWVRVSLSTSAVVPL